MGRSGSVIWVESSLSDLETIRNKYKQSKGEEAGSSIVKVILSKIQLITRYPFIGPMEDKLKAPNTSFRRVICMGYRIIYSVEAENDLILIHAVVDARGVPAKWIQ